MRSAPIVCLIALGVLALPRSSTSAQHKRPRAITQCSWGGNTFDLQDAPLSTHIGTYNDIDLTGRMLSDEGATFTLSRGSHKLFEKKIADISNPNGWLGVSDDQQFLALNTSNGGATGGWSVAILHVTQSGAVEDLSPAMDIVAQQFSVRHTCYTRVNNYEAIQWRKGNQLLISAEVYPTSDCGKEMGHTQGYLLDPLTRRITAHYTNHQLLGLPYVCTQNVWQPGDPTP